MSLAPEEPSQEQMETEAMYGRWLDAYRAEMTRYVQDTLTVLDLTENDPYGTVTKLARQELQKRHPLLPDARAAELYLRSWVDTLRIHKAEVKVYLSTRLLVLDDFALLSGMAEQYPATEGSWVGFIDHEPDCNWAHECSYLFIDPDRSTRHQRERWPLKTGLDLFRPINIRDKDFLSKLAPKGL